MHNNIFVPIRDLWNTTFLIMFVYNKKKYVTKILKDYYY